VTNGNGSEWFASWFDSVHYHKLYAHRDDAEAARFLDALTTRLRPGSGARALDLGCGAGRHSRYLASKGLQVTGVDLAENLLELARGKAKQQGLENIDFQSGDMTRLPFAGESFDVVVCVFGIFFVPDMESALRELKRVLRTGGKLAITTWGPRFFEPANTAFWNSVRNARPDLYKGFNPWDRICEVDDLRTLLETAGFKESEVKAESGSQPVDSPDDWWAMIMGSGYRGTVEQLDANAREAVRQQNLDFIQNSAVRSVEANVVYATAIKARE